MGNNKMDDFDCVVICVDTHTQIEKPKSPFGLKGRDLHLHPPQDTFLMKRYFFSLFQIFFVLHGSCSICVCDKQSHTRTHIICILHNIFFYLRAHVPLHKIMSHLIFLMFYSHLNIYISIHAIDPKIKRYAYIYICSHPLQFIWKWF